MESTKENHSYDPINEDEPVVQLTSLRSPDESDMFGVQKILPRSTVEDNRKKKRRKKCIYGKNLFTGWRQQELLSRLLPRVSEEFQNTLLEVVRKEQSIG